MAYKLKLKRGLESALPTGDVGEPLWTTDTFDLYIGKGTSNQRYQKYIASGTSAQFLKGDGTLDSNTYALDSTVVKLTGNQTIGGTKTFNGVNFVVASSAGQGAIDFGTGLDKGTIGYSTSTFGFIFNNASAAVGSDEVYKFQLLNSDLFTINGYGAGTFVSDVNANAFVKTGGTSTQYLMADGSTSTLTNPVTGTGTTNYLPKWTSGSALGNSIVSESGSIITIAGSSRFTGFDSGYYNENILGIGNATYNPKIGLASVTGYRWNTRIKDVGGDGEYVIRYEEGSLDALVIKRGGNILVGTYIDNGNRLQVTGSASFSGQLVQTLGDNQILYTNTSATTGYQYMRMVSTGASLIWGIDANPTASVFTGSLANSAVIGNGKNAPFHIATNAIVRLTVDAPGNLGLGVTPSAWGGGTFGFDIGSGSAIYNPGSGNQTQILNNSYNNGTNFIYKNTSAAARYRMIGASHEWFSADSGTAGTAITFTQAMTLDASGRLGIGTANPDGNLVVAAGTNGTASTGGYIGLTTGVNNSKVRGAAIEAFTTDTSNNHGLRFYTNAAASSPTVKMTLTDIGNLGLSVVPSAWRSTTKAIESLAGSIFDFSTTSKGFVQNGYLADAGWIYKSTAAASSYEAAAGGHQWFNAPSGTAGTAISFTQAMTLTAAGRLLLGTTTEGTHLLDVNGSGRFSGNTTSSPLELANTIISNYIWMNSATGYEAMSRYSNPTAGNWYTGIRASAGLGTTASYHIYSSTYGEDVFVLNTDATSKFAGAATFSSSVTSTDYNLSALNTAPATSSSTGTVGQIRIDANHIYVCTATNTWKRVAIATF